MALVALVKRVLKAVVVVVAAMHNHRDPMDLALAQGSFAHNGISSHLPPRTPLGRG